MYYLKHEGDSAMKFDMIINNLIINEDVENKCPYCWGKATETSEGLICIECDVKVGESCELI